MSNSEVSDLEKEILNELQSLTRLKNLRPTTLTLLLFSFLAEEIGSIKVNKSTLENLHILNFKVGEENKGRIIGKKGHILKAICSVSKAFAKARGKDIIVSVED